MEAEIDIRERKLQKVGKEGTAKQKQPTTHSGEIEAVRKLREEMFGRDGNKKGMKIDGTSSCRPQPTKQKS